MSAENENEKDLAVLSDEQRLHAATVPPMALEVFCERMSKRPETILNWVDAGWLQLKNINGRWYLLAEEIMRFNLRVSKGEFKKDLGAPPGRRGWPGGKRKGAA